MNTTKPEIRRRCRKCGYVYRYHFSILGIPRCPKCWGYEYTCVEYIDKKGRAIKYEPKPHRESKDFIPCWHEDVGCEIATDFIGKQSKCTENCPFIPKCLYELTYGDRIYLQQWRMMIRVYELTDKGLKPAGVARKTGLSRYLIGEWLNGRDFFEPFIRRPVMAGSVK